MNNESFDITNDGGLVDAVYSETQYNEGHISEADVRDLLNGAKRLLALRASVTDFYGDRGLAVALEGMTCAKVKGAVENSPVRVSNVGPDDVTFRTSDGESLQLAQYEDMVQRGLSNAESTDAGTQGVEITNTHFNDSKGL